MTFTGHVINLKGHYVWISICSLIYGHHICLQWTNHSTVAFTVQYFICINQLSTLILNPSLEASVNAGIVDLLDEEFNTAQLQFWPSHQVQKHAYRATSNLTSLMSHIQGQYGWSGLNWTTFWGIKLFLHTLLLAARPAGQLAATFSVAKLQDWCKNGCEFL